MAHTSSVLKKGAYASALGGCVGCHFNEWKGFSANPRIGDQSTAYLAATIRQFRSGSRAIRLACRQKYAGRCRILLFSLVVTISSNGWMGSTK